MIKINRLKTIIYLFKSKNAHPDKKTNNSFDTQPLSVLKYCRRLKQ